MNSTPRHIPLRPEGLPLIGGTAWLALVFAVLGWALAACILLLAMLFCLQFFRDPDRVVPDEPGAAVAPADGRVVRVDRAIDPADGQEKDRVAIFMHVFNVHVNRAPVGAEVAAQRYSPGRFHAASRDKASRDNEHNVICLTDALGSNWTVVQIAGWVARRILSWVETGGSLQRGQRLGMIQFSSRVDLYLPRSYEIVVSRRQKVVAGQTVVARHSEEGVGETERS
ncbi:MAG: phosphatidylserine decarboxylase family protein [Desulfohalobiaceae bacterium]|nr:phosphatidylserine decarboxylase family protein [Desulfohalobiaceae bacterium]